MDYTCQLARWLGISHRVGLDLCYWLITESSKIISKTSVEHITHDDYLQADKKAKIEEFNTRLEESLSDAYFVIKGKGEYDSLYLDDIEDEDLNPGVVQADKRDIPSNKDYGDMLIDERPKDNDKEAIDKFLNIELIMNIGTNNE